MIVPDARDDRIDDLPGDCRFRSRERLTKKREFDAILLARRSAAGARIILYGLPNQRSHNRLGISVGRRYGGAVVRNRFKRLCREAFRLSKQDQPRGWDWLILPIVRKGAQNAGRMEPTTPTLEVIRRDFLRLSRKIAR